MAAKRELEQRLERAEQQLGLVQRIVRYLVRDVSLPEALHGIVAHVVDFLECDSCLLYFLEGDKLVLCATNSPDSGPVGKVSLQLSEGLTGWVARERRLLAISREAFHDPRFKLFSDLPEDTYEAFLSAPIIERNRVVGVINVQHRLPHAHTGGEMELLTTVGELVGCLLRLARCEEGGVESAADLALTVPGPRP